MDDSTFAHQVAAWLDPQILLYCALRYQLASERPRALRPSALAITNAVFQDGDEGNFAELVARFLRGFSVPAPVLELIARTRGSVGVSDDTWRWLRDLRFTGTVRVCRRDNPPQGAPRNTILIIEERDAVVDLLEAPVMALLDLVQVLSESWRRVSELGVSVFHEPSMPTPFYAYVDREVGRSFVTFEAPPHSTDTVGPKWRYRAVTLYGRALPDSPLWEIVRQAARGAAASTLKPLPQAQT